MIKLANNYSYRFIKDNVKVATICKRKTNDTLIVDFDKYRHVVMNPLRYTYYTEPVVGNDGVTRNTLLAFKDTELCSKWMDNVKRSGEVLKPDTINTVIDDIAPPSAFDDKIIFQEFSLYDVKSVSEELRVALMVVIDSRNNDYDVYYYNSKHKQTNY
jgi:hypothetical protein